MTYCQGTWSLQRDGCTYSWRWQNNWSLDNFCPFSGSPWRPEVYSFSKNNSISLYNSVTTNGNGLQRLFSLPLSPEAYDKFQLLINSIGDCHLNSEFDRWNYIWGNPAFSTRKAYLHLKGQAAIHPAFKWLRKSNWQTKHKILFWLILKDRFWGTEKATRGGVNGSRSKILAIESPAYDPKFTGEYQYRIAQDGYRHLQYPQSEYEHT